MLTTVIEGETHPKKVTIVNDDKEVLNQDIIDKLRATDWDELAAKFEAAPFEDGELRVEIPTEAIGEFVDFLGEFYPASPAFNDLSAMRKDAEDQVEQAISEGTESAS